MECKLRVGGKVCGRNSYWNLMVKNQLFKELSSYVQLDLFSVWDQLPIGTPKIQKALLVERQTPVMITPWEPRGAAVSTWSATRASVCKHSHSSGSSHLFSFSPNLSLKKWPSEVTLKEYKVSGWLLKISEEVNHICCFVYSWQRLESQKMVSCLVKYTFQKLDIYCTEEEEVGFLEKCTVS